MGPEYVTWQINSHILLFDFCTASKILICLIKRFSNNHKRYFCHLQVLIWHQVVPVKVYLTVYENRKNSYFKKKFLYHKKEMFLANANPRAALYKD